MSELIDNRAHRMRTLKEDGTRKVSEGLTDFTQVRKVCIE